VTVPSTAEPKGDNLNAGFTISAWVQPSPLCDGFIVDRSTTDGSGQYYSVRLAATATSTTITLAITPVTAVVSGKVKVKVDL
jgi:hypothetical protein